MDLIILAFALWFFLQALISLLDWMQVPAPRRSAVLFVYGLCAGLLLLYMAGYFPGHTARL